MQRTEILTIGLSYLEGIACQQLLLLLLLKFDREKGHQLPKGGVQDQLPRLPRPHQFSPIQNSILNIRSNSGQMRLRCAISGIKVEHNESSPKHIKQQHVSDKPEKCLGG